MTMLPDTILGQPVPEIVLRDSFAASALVSIPPQSAYNMLPNESHEHYVARRAYMLADAMMKARK